ncbi:MAG: hypothetical protein FOGNACKC_05609 [Anaerolineae bacterium]|nr:hypothetical protein [Anaerolineae bacterium]
MVGRCNPPPDSKPGLLCAIISENGPTVPNNPNEATLTPRVSGGSMATWPNDNCTPDTASPAKAAPILHPARQPDQRHFDPNSTKTVPGPSAANGLLGRTANPIDRPPPPIKSGPGDTDPTACLRLFFVTWPTQFFPVAAPACSNATPVPPNLATLTRFFVPGFFSPGQKPTSTPTTFFPLPAPGLRVDGFAPQSTRLFERVPARRFGGWPSNWVVLPFLPANTTAENRRGARAGKGAGSVPRLLRLTARFPRFAFRYRRAVYRPKRLLPNAPFQRRLDGYPAKRQFHPRYCFTGESSANFTPGSPAKPTSL